MSKRLIDGIIWLVIGVSLVMQSTFLVLAIWPSTESLHGDSALISRLVEGGVVGAGLLILGLRAIYWGVRMRLLGGNEATPQRDPSHPVA